MDPCIGWLPGPPAELLFDPHLLLLPLLPSSPVSSRRRVSWASTPSTF
jgi:hypothetical protein